MTTVLTFLKASPHVPTRVEKQVFITNILSVIFFFITLGILAIFYSLFGWISTLPFIVLIAALFLIIPFANRWLDHRAGRMAICLIPAWLTMFVTLYFKSTAGENLSDVFYFDSRFILLATTILPGILFRLEERVQLIVCLGSTSIFVLFYDSIHELFNVGYFQRGFADESYAYVSYIVAVTYMTLLFGILLLRSILERSERELISQNKELFEKQNEIEAQHEELLQHQEEMLASAEKLEQANTLIVSQQDALEKYNKTLEALVDEKSSELRKTNEELVKHNNELLQFSYTVSHNLRGPVARMLGLTRLLRKSDDEADRVKLEELILKSSEELDEILKDLSLIIDIRNELYRLREKITLQDEWNKAVSLIGESVKSVYHLQVDFSDAPQVYGIRPMVQSIFYNLFSNAIKYQSPDRKLRVNVVSRRLSDGCSVIEVSDNGLGIDLANQEKNLFKLYKRFHPHVSGRGLGLYLVKTQVETMGANIFVESEVDKGTVFRIVFPKPEEVVEQVFYENDAVRLVYQSVERIIILQWKRPATSAEYRDAVQVVAASMNIYDTAGWVSDSRKLGPVDPKDERWVLEKVLPQSATGDGKKICIVTLDAQGRQSYIEQLKSLSDIFHYEFHLAGNMEDAMTWIRSKDHKLKQEST